MRLILLALALTYAGPSAPLVRGVDSIVITVSDLDRSLDFYTNVLTFEKVADEESAGSGVEASTGVFGTLLRSARLRLGDEFIELREFLAPKGKPVPEDSHSNDGWFQHIAIITADMPRAYAWLRQHKVRHSSPGPQRLPDWNPNAGGIEAFYFQDPDGHALEVLAFPAGKGAAKWHKASSRMFLGIDHTAIVIQDTEASLRFYRDVLGMTIAGSSENYGIEQERLNNVFGAHLRITAMRGAQGPGIEFLEYVSPRGGRPYPASAQPNDLVHWQTRFLGVDVTDAARLLQQNRASFVSLPPRSQGSAKSIVIRDPDGHALEIQEANHSTSTNKE